MKSTLLLITLLSTTLVSTAQNNFKRGYIITFENDTINGLIDFRTSSMNAKICTFKTDKMAPTKAYYPTDITGYRFEDEGKLYVARTIEIEGKPETVFLEFLLEGIVNLYYYINESEYYFVEDSTGKITSISRKEEEKVYNSTKDKEMLKTDYRYIGVLKYLFNDSNSTISKLDQVKYTQDDIISITKSYHDDVCMPGQTCIIFQTQKDRRYTNKKISIYSGVQFYSLDLKFAGDGTLYGMPIINSTFPIIGAQLDLSVPRWNKSISFVLDVAFSGISGNNFINDGDTYSRKYIYKTLLSANKLGGKYTFGESKFRPTIEAGLNTIFLFGSSSTFTRYFNNNIGAPWEAKDEYFPGSPFIGYYGSVGFNYFLASNKAILVRVGYESLRNFTYIEASSNSTIKALSIKLGYTF